MNRDHDHDIADLFVRQANTKSKLIRQVCEEKGIEFIDIPLVQANTKFEDCEGYPQLFQEPVLSPIETCKHALWVAENEGQLDESQFHRAMEWLDNLKEETKDADLYRDRVLEDRYCELLRLGQGDLAEPDFMGGSEPLQFGDSGYTSTEPDSFPQSCPCPTCSGDGWED